jgi:hypothetical protein
VTPLLLLLYCLAPLPALAVIGLIVNLVYADAVSRREVARTARELTVNGDPR